MALQEDVIQAVSNGNFKTIGDSSAQFSNLILNDAVVASRNMTAIREKSVARSLERFDSVNSDEEGNVGTSYATLIGLVQQIAKMAQTTRPETGA